LNAARRFRGVSPQIISPQCHFTAALFHNKTPKAWSIEGQLMLKFLTRSHCCLYAKMKNLSQNFHSITIVVAQLKFLYFSVFKRFVSVTETLFPSSSPWMVHDK
jgi:hypothetical protein